MSALVQNSIVAIAVLLAVYSVVRRFAPITLRQRARELLAIAASAVRLQRLAEKLRRRATPTGACGACGGCSEKIETSKTTATVKIRQVPDSRRPGSRC